MDATSIDALADGPAKAPAAKTQAKARPQPKAKAAPAVATQSLSSLAADRASSSDDGTPAPLVGLTEGRDRALKALKGMRP